MLRCIRSFSLTHTVPHVMSISSICNAVRVPVRRPRVPNSMMSEMRRGVIMRFLRPMGESARSVKWRINRLYSSSVRTWGMVFSIFG